MTITNNSNQTIGYRADRAGGSDCGDIAPSDDVVLPSFDNKTTVKVVLHLLKTGDETEIIVADPGL